MKDILGKAAGVLILAGILFGVFALITVPIEAAKKAAAEHWPSRKGVITTSYKHRTPGMSTRHGTPTVWKVEICGNYRDDGTRFCIDRVRYGDFRWGGGKAKADAALEKFPIGREVDVYYDPNDPGRTILEPRSSWNVMYAIGSIGLFGLLLPVILYLFRKQIEPEKYSESK